MFFRSILYFLITSSSIFGAYLKFVPLTITQPDGSQIKCYSSGDEFYNWVHDEEGYTIVRSEEDGFCYYANEDLTPSIHKVGNSNPASLGIKKWIKLPKEDYLAIRDEYIENDIKRTPTVGTVLLMRMSLVEVLPIMILHLI